MCPVAAESKNSNPSSKKKINKKIDSNLENYQEKEKISKGLDPIQNSKQMHEDDKGSLDNNDEFNGSDEDAKALEFYKSEGNEIIELAEDVQVNVKNEAVKWGKTQGETNDWFKKAYESQLAYETLWKDASRYRNVATAN